MGYVEYEYEVTDDEDDEHIKSSCLLRSMYLHYFTIHQL
jgi:hypothetical protein